MATTMSLALLNALGPTGCPPDLDASLEAEVGEGFGEPGFLLQLFDGGPAMKLVGGCWLP